MNNHEYTYAIGTMYMDIVGECEKLGDYVVNVVEARMELVSTRQEHVTKMRHSHMMPHHQSIDKAN